jgi:hypothetical protein
MELFPALGFFEIPADLTSEALFIRAVGPTMLAIKHGVQLIPHGAP